MHNNIIFPQISKLFFTCGILFLPHTSCSKAHKSYMGNAPNNLSNSSPETNTLKPKRFSANNVPNELLEDIFKCLPRKALHHTRFVSKRFCFFSQKEIQARPAYTEWLLEDILKCLPSTGLHY